jgi:hypothetical protein
MSLISNDGQCVWQGTQDIQGNSSSTIPQHFLITPVDYTVMGGRSAKDLFLLSRLRD